MYIYIYTYMLYTCLRIYVRGRSGELQGNIFKYDISVYIYTYIQMNIRIPIHTYMCICIYV